MNVLLLKSIYYSFHWKNNDVYSHHLQERKCRTRFHWWCWWNWTSATKTKVCSLTFAQKIVLLSGCFCYSYTYIYIYVYSRFNAHSMSPESNFLLLIMLNSSILVDFHVIAILLNGWRSPWIQLQWITSGVGYMHLVVLRGVVYILFSNSCHSFLWHRDMSKYSQLLQW